RARLERSSDVARFAESHVRLAGSSESEQTPAVAEQGVCDLVRAPVFAPTLCGVRVESACPLAVAFPLRQDRARAGDRVPRARVDRRGFGGKEPPGGGGGPVA